MSEERLLIDHLKLEYEGIFEMPAIYALINQYFYDKGYDWREPLNVEQTFPEGKSVRMELKPYKNITDYFKMTYRIRINGVGLKKVEIEKDGGKVIAYEGKFILVVDGFLMSDRYDLWSKRPLQWFIRTIFDKYIYKNYYSTYEQWMLSDIEDLMLKIKQLLNVYSNYHARDVYTSRVL